MNQFGKMGAEGFEPPTPGV